MSDAMASSLPTAPGEQEPRWVRYVLLCEGAHDQYVVRSLWAREHLSEPYELRLELAALDDSGDLNALLGKSVSVQLERGGSVRRSFCGIVDEVVVDDDNNTRPTGTIHVVPALRLLGDTRESRAFQGRNPVDILCDTLEFMLRPWRREVGAELLHREDYTTRDLCVQYQEPYLDFVHRIMEEEGIGYYFEHGEVERMILFDDSTRFSELPAEAHPWSVVRYDRTQRARSHEPPVTHFSSRAKLRHGSIAVRDHDWRRRQSTVSDQRGSDHPLHYEHGYGRSVTLHEQDALVQQFVTTALRYIVPDGMPFEVGGEIRDVPGVLVDAFTQHDAAAKAERRQQELVRDRLVWRGRGVVECFAPGLRFEFVGHPTMGADGTYALVGVTHASHQEALGNPGDVPDGVESTSYVDHFECIPLTTQWRPARRVRKPRIYGVQTATVIGPPAMEIFTDAYGRVRLLFHWDRHAGPPLPDSSGWVRVSQAWAGASSPGFSFIPRVGMEVIVAFEDGDPDRPLVVGCVHNGANPTPQLLPLHATRSVLRTRTVPFGEGYNELSFEDAAGHEELYLRGQRDLTVHVGHNQYTVVGCDQFSDVLGARRTVVGGDDTTSVRGQRLEEVDGPVVRGIGGDVRSSIGGNDHQRVRMSSHLMIETGGRLVQVLEGEHVLISKGRVVISQDGTNHIVIQSADDPKGISIESCDSVVIKAGEATVELNTAGDGSISVSSPKRIELAVGGSRLEITPDKIVANNKTMPV